LKYFSEIQSVAAKTWQVWQHLYDEARPAGRRVLVRYIGVCIRVSDETHQREVAQ